MKPPAGELATSTGAWNGAAAWLFLGTAGGTAFFHDLGWPLQLAVLTLWARALRSSGSANSACIVLFPLGWFGAALHYLPSSLDHAGASWDVTLLGWAAATLPLALSLAGWAWVTHRAHTRWFSAVPQWRGPVALALWAATEWARGESFPGGSLAGAAVMGPLAGAFPIGGALLAGTLFFATAWGMAGVLERWRTPAGQLLPGGTLAMLAMLAMLAALWGACWLLGQRDWSTEMRHADGQPWSLTVALLQTGETSVLRRHDERIATEQLAERLPGLLAQVPRESRLVVTPEDWVLTPLSRLHPALSNAFGRWAREEGRGDLLLGVLAAAPGDDHRLTPASLLIRRSELAAALPRPRWDRGTWTPWPARRYDKRRLIPWAESPPAWWPRFAVSPLPHSDLQPGDAPAPGAWTLEGPVDIAPSLCYEFLFGGDIARQSRSGADGTTASLLINQGFQGWLRGRAALDYHHRFARMRALELARPVLRADARGLTAVINPDGRTRHLLNPDVDGVLVASVTPRTGETPYARWQDLPLLTVICTVLIAAALAGFPRRLAGRRAKAKGRP